MLWKDDWAEARRNWIRWWNGEGLALSVTAPRRTPIERVPPPPPAPADLAARWCDPAYRAARAEWEIAHTAYLAEAFPYFAAQIGPGSLGTFLGSQPNFAPDTVWYEPCIADADAFGPLRFEPAGNRWLDVHVALVDEALRRSRGRYLVAPPDLIENIDTLAALRGTQTLLVDLLERPAWVHARLGEINEAFFRAFDLFFAKVRDAEGGSAFIFDIWGPGRTCKVQCDFSCMISPRMFREFVVPPLEEQCRWLDYAMYHLDGTTAVHHVQALCEIPSLRAIEWTPQAGLPGGGSPEWYDLYRRLRAGGKAVQAVGVRPEEVVPLIEAVGPEGLCIQTRCADEDEARRLVDAAERYR